MAEKTLDELSQTVNSLMDTPNEMVKCRCGITMAANDARLNRHCLNPKRPAAIRRPRRHIKVVLESNSGYGLKIPLRPYLRPNTIGQDSEIGDDLRMGQSAKYGDGLRMGQSSIAGDALRISRPWHDLITGQNFRARDDLRMGQNSRYGNNSRLGQSSRDGDDFRSEQSAGSEHALRMGLAPGPQRRNPHITRLIALLRTVNEVGLSASEREEYLHLATNITNITDEEIAVIRNLTTLRDDGDSNNAATPSANAVSAIPNFENLSINDELSTAQTATDYLLNAIPNFENLSINDQRETE